jgi:hypothetical protein
MKYCPGCKNQYQDTEVFCPIDGMRLQSGGVPPVAGPGGIKCPKCGKIYPAGTAFCSTDGTKLELQLQCPKCGTIVQDGDIYCPKCGRRLTTPDSGIQPPENGSPPENEEVILVSLPIFEQTPGMPPANSFNPYTQDARLLRHGLNTVFLKQLRRFGLKFGETPSPSPEVIAAIVQEVDSHISTLQTDPNTCAQEFLPHATQAAAFWLYAALSLGPLEALGTDKVESFPLPPKYKAILRNPKGIVCAVQSLTFGVHLSLFWPEGEFHRVETAFGNNTANFRNVVCQSLRELFYLTYPTVALKERFLAEENFKLNHGYYPDSIRNDVKQLLATLSATLQKYKQAFANAPNAEQNVLLMRVSPLSIPLFAGPFSLPHRTFTAEEQRAFSIFANYGLESPNEATPGDKLLTFLLNMLQEQEANADGVGVRHPYFVVAAQAHYFLTCYCNTLGPRVPGKKYQNLPHKGLPVGLNWEMVIQKMVTIDDQKGNV